MHACMMYVCVCVCARACMVVSMCAYVCVCVCVVSLCLCSTLPPSLVLSLARSLTPSHRADADCGERLPIAPAEA